MLFFPLQRVTHNERTRGERDDQAGERNEETNSKYRLHTKPEVCNQLVL